MAELAKKDEPVDAPRAAARRGGGAFQAPWASLQGRDHRQHPGERGRLAVPRRRVRGPVPRPARAEHGQAQALQADEGGRRLLARRPSQRDAAAHLRHGLGDARTSCSSTCTCSRRPRSATTASSAASSTCSTSTRTRPGVVFWHPKGWALWQEVEQYMRQVYRDTGYQEVKGPQILDKSLWEKTGHWENYRENMFTTESEKREYALKPMNCPGHVLIFKSGIAQLPRPADALRRVRPVPPQRAERRAARDHAGARLHAGRRPHLLHRGPDPRRVRRLHGAAAEGLHATSASPTSSTRSRRGPRTASAPTSSGTRPSTR